ncbi:MAG: LamG-like jellyroll fold domain-containing protein [Coleofasciculus sp.]|uniref:LamG-like jellyroll fold domain-containing protein n=1 Tax=Coleofasciculus sp. TaxID=3100458 RepID=UPI003A1BC4C7
MSTSDTGLVLYLPLDSISSENKVIDASDQGNNGTIQGNVEVVPDETFGSCLTFDGSGGYVEIADPFKNRTTFTLSLWVKPSILNDGAYHGFIGKPESNIRKPGLWLSPSNGGLHYDSYNTSRARSSGTIDNFFTSAGEWVHVVWVKAGTEYKFYRNGELFVTKAAPEQFYTVESTNYWIGKVDNFWKGEIAYARIYNRALSVEEIKGDIEADKVALAAFRKTHPISFSLYDDNDNPVLYIDDASGGHTLRLKISNTSPQTIRLLESTNKTASGKNYHFELRFRPDTLAKDSLKNLALVEAASGWSMAYDEVNGIVSLLSISTNERVIQPNESIVLTLQHVSAAADGGARGTRVELRYQQLQYQGETITLSDSRVQHLSIVNHQGRKYIPLHVGFVGGNTVLNDGSSPNELTLQISNVLKKGQISLNPKIDQKSTYTRFFISFDVSESIQSEWSLGNRSELKAIEIKPESSFTLVGTLTESVINGTRLILNQSLVRKIPKNASLRIIPAKPNNNLLSTGENIFRGFSSNVPNSPITINLNPENSPISLNPEDGLILGEPKITIKPITFPEDPQDVTVSEEARVGQSIINLSQQVLLQAGAKVYLDWSSLWKVNENNEGQSSEWIITIEDVEKAFLEAGDFIRLTLSNVISSSVSGHTNLYLRYENIPGYWDGQFVVPIEKAPILYRKNKVGIGISEPSATLEIEDTHKTQLHIRKKESQTGIAFHAGDNASSIQFLKFGTKHAGLVFDGSKISIKGMSSEVDHNPDQTLSTTETVNVEIKGTVKATAIEGNGAVVAGMIMMWSGSVNEIPSGWALCDGRTVNGRKTPDLRGRFIVGYSAGSSDYGELGKTGGIDKVSLGVDEMPSHEHTGATLSNGSHYHWIEGTDAEGLANRKRTIWGDTTVDMGFGGGWNNDKNAQMWRGHVNTDTVSDHNHSFTTNRTGGGKGHENRPPYYVLAYIMKV